MVEVEEQRLLPSRTHRPESLPIEITRFVVVFEYIVDNLFSFFLSSYFLLLFFFRESKLPVNTEAYSEIIFDENEKASFFFILCAMTFIESFFF